MRTTAQHGRVSQWLQCTGRMFPLTHLMCTQRYVFCRQPPARSHFPPLVFFSPTYRAVNSLMHQWSCCSLKLISWADAEGNNGLGIKRMLVIHRRKCLQQAFVVHWVFVLFQINMRTSSTGRGAVQQGKGTSNYEGLIANDTEGTHHIKYSALNKTCNTVMDVSASQSHPTAPQP